MGFWSTLGKIGGGIAAGVAAPFTAGASLTALPTILGGAAGALGAISQGQASNRGEKLSGQMDLERLLMERELTNDRTQQNAWQRLLSSQHVASPGARPQLSPYSIAPRQATDLEMQGANALSQNALARLQAPNPQLNVDRGLLDPGILERITGYASPVLGALSRLPQNVDNSRGNALARILAMNQAPRA